MFPTMEKLDHKFGGMYQHVPTVISQRFTTLRHAKLTDFGLAKVRSKGKDFGESQRVQR